MLKIEIRLDSQFLRFPFIISYPICFESGFPPVSKMEMTTNLQVARQFMLLLAQETKLKPRLAQ